MKRKSKITITWQYDGSTPWKRSNEGSWFTLDLSLLLKHYYVERIIVFAQHQGTASVLNLFCIANNVFSHDVSSIGLYVFCSNHKQKEAELRKLTGCLCLHNPSFSCGIHRPGPETPNKSFHTTRLIWQSQNPEPTENSGFGRHFISSDYWLQLKYPNSALIRDIRNRRWCNGKSSLQQSRIQIRLLIPSLPLALIQLLWQSGMSLYRINILHWIQLRQLLYAGKILEASLKVNTEKAWKELLTASHLLAHPCRKIFFLYRC